MTESFIRHFVAAMGTLLVGIAYYAGYVAGGHGWSWAILGVLIVYPIVYGIVNAGNH